MTIYKNQGQAVITLATGQDLTGATKTEFHVVKPNGTTATWAATESGIAGSLTYTTDADDIDQSGLYLVVAYVEWGGVVPGNPGDPFVLEVMETDFNVSAYTNNPSARPIDAVRLELGKDLSLALLTDSEISYNLTRAGNNKILAAAFCAENIAGQYASLVDKSMGNSSVSLSQKAEAWRKKAIALRAQAMSPTLTPRASSSASGARKFSLGQHDNISGGSYSITGYL